MKLSCRKIKYPHIGIPFLVLSIAVNAASIIEKENELLEEYEQARIISSVTYKEIIEPNKITPVLSQQEKDESLNTPIDINKQKQLNLIQSDTGSGDTKDLFTEPTTPVRNISKANVRAIENTPIVNESQDWFNEENSNIEINFSRSNQKGIIENSQQLKILAHNLFGDETLEDLIVTQHEIKNLFYQADAWVKEVLFDDSHWRLEDSIYGSAAILFINDSSLIRFLRKFDDSPDELKQLTTNLEQQSKTDNRTSNSFESDSVLLRGYFSIIDFLNKYAGKIIYIILSIIIFRELFNLITKALKPKQKTTNNRRHKSRSRSASSKSMVLNSTNPAVEKGNSENAILENKEKPDPSSRHRHRMQRHRPKRSRVRKILDNTFGKSKYKS